MHEDHGRGRRYREEHDIAPEELEAAFTSSGAGFRTHSVFAEDGHIYWCMDVDEPDVIRAVMTESDAQAAWVGVMDTVLEDADDVRMDDVYRML
jgi:L-rhamnose mutarotase